MSLTTNPLSQTPSQADPESTPDPRPRFGIGHISLGVADVDRAAAFYSNVGMRLVVNMTHAAILELRGGTHLIVHEHANPGSGSLDLIVDDIDDTHAVLAAHDAAPSVIERGSPHDRFVATDPDGNQLIVNSNHAMGPV